MIFAQIIVSTMESRGTATSVGGSTTVVCHEVREPRKLVLKLKDPDEQKVSKKGVQWEEGTIDNEHLCKKSSKSMFYILS